MDGNAAAFVKRLEGLVEKKKILNHPFYATWAKGELTMEALRGYARQYYRFVAAFPRYLSAVHSNCPDLATRQKILGNLAEEEREDKPHPELWLRFGEALGLEREEMTDGDVTPETRSALSVLEAICRDGSFVEGAAALWAYESQVPEVARVKAEGLREFYGITDAEALEYFTVHEDVDVEHAAIGEAIVAEHTRTPAEEDRVERAVKHSLDASWLLLDGVQREYVTN